MPAPILLTVALLSVVAPFATDLYLAAFPTMVTDLATTATGVQLTLTGFMIGIAAGQLVFGPLSDRYGRMRPMLVGSIVCVAASVVTALAPSIGVLIGARLVQGFAGAAGMVIGRAVISDLATGRAAARAFSLMMMIGGVAPIAAPLLGSVLVGSIGWRGIFWVVTALVVATVVAILAVLRETHHPDQRTGLSVGGLRVLASRGYLGYTIINAATFAAMMAYVSASPFVYQGMMGLGAVPYGLVFGGNAVAMIGSSALSARLARTRPVHRLLATGLTGMTVGTAALLLLVLAGAGPGWYEAAIVIIVASLGFVFGNATALALAHAHGLAGTGSAILGALQFVVGAIAAPLVGIAGEDTALPLALVITGAVLLAAAALGLAGRDSATVLEDTHPV